MKHVQRRIHIDTPAAKAAVSEHDVNITFERTVKMIGAALAEQIRDVSIRLYVAASEIAAKKASSSPTRSSSSAWTAKAY
jgi:phosphoribosylaminoimidazole-succinocarboxamide synthase